MLSFLIQKFPQLQSESFMQLIKYVLVGGICTLLDFALLFILTHYLGIYYVVSSLLSFAAGTILNYYLCTLWIFQVRTVSDRRIEFFYYCIIAVGGMLLTTFIIWLLVQHTGIQLMLAKLIAAFLVLGLSFSARKYFLHT